MIERIICWQYLDRDFSNEPEIIERFKNSLLKLSESEMQKQNSRCEDYEKPEFKEIEFCPSGAGSILGIPDIPCYRLTMILEPKK